MYGNSARNVASLLSVCLIVATLLIAWVDVRSGFAQVMQSTNYQIEFDSINVAGGLSESDNYIIQDTTGEIATGPSGSASYQLRAGYQQMNETYLALTPADPVVLAPIGGVTGGSTVGSTTVTVTTDNLAGYELSIRASSSPAMQHLTESASFLDYVPEFAVPDFTFAYGDTESVFAFSVTGVDTIARFLDDGGVCGTGAFNAVSACWDGLSTSDQSVALRTTPNHPAGTETRLLFQAGIGENVNQLAGSYRATTTVTVIAR
jgi:hypothetical protein